MNRTTIALGLIVSSCLATAPAAVVFTDNFDHKGASVADFTAAGWTTVYGTAGGNIGTGNAAATASPETVLWGNSTSGGNTEAALEYNYMGARVTCGDIIKIEANCTRLTGYDYLEEIILWDGSNPATRVVATNWSGKGVSDQWPGWWSPPSKGAINTLVYNATSGDAGKYVIFKYGHGPSWGETADVTFSITPVSVAAITEQPKSAVRTAGEPVSFRVAALGCGLAYQWKKNGSNIPSATGDTYSIPVVTAGDAGTYEVSISNSFGTTNSVIVSLEVTPKAATGASASFAVNFGDEIPWNPVVTAPAFGVHPSRWFHTPPGSEAGPINESGQIYTFGGAGQFNLSYSAKNTYSTPGAVETLPPGDAQVTYGYLDDGSPGYVVDLFGLSSFGYEKYVIMAIASSDNATNFAPVTVTDDGAGKTYTLTYGPTFRANPSGGTAARSTPSPVMSSDSFHLASVRDGTTLTRGTLAGFIVTDRPVIVAQPVAPTNVVFNGESFTLKADAIGVTNLSFQWVKDGTNVPGATTTTLARSSAVVADSGVYQFVASNAYGTASSISATVTVVSFIPPTFLQQPVSQTVYLGRPATFTALGYGGQLTYQWNKGGSPIPGATNTSYRIANVTAADQTNYTVTITNPAGNATSQAARLTVTTVPTQGYLGAVLTDGPISFWRVGESTGTTAVDSWGGNNGTYSGSYTLGVSPVIEDSDPALRVAPTAKVSVPFSAALNNPAGPFSTEFWVLPTTAGQECIISSQKRDSGRAGYTIFMKNGGNGFSALMGNSAGGTVWVNGNTAVQPGVKYHVVLTYDGTTGRIYVNGKLDGTSALAFGADGFEANPDAPFQIGARNAGDGFPYNGIIDEVAVYNYALPESKIKAHLLAGAPLRVAVQTVANVVLNSKPEPNPVHGVNYGATYVATDSDGTKTRTGVMQFVGADADLIEVSGYPQIDATNSTISFWIRATTNTATGSEAAMIMDRRDTGGSGSGTVIALKDDGTIFFQANPSGANPFSSATAVNDGKWHLITLVCRQDVGEAVTIYVDGVIDNSSANTKAWYWPQGMTLMLGNSRDGYWRKFHGMLDDFRVYNRALNDTEVAQLASSTFVDNAALQMQLTFDSAPVATGLRITSTPTSGVIQSAPSLTGSFTDVGTTPMIIIPTAPAQFFRVK